MHNVTEKILGFRLQKCKKYCEYKKTRKALE